MSYQSAVKGIDAALSRAGESVVIRRYVNTGIIECTCLAKIEGVSAHLLRTGMSSMQGNSRAILSPTPFLSSSFPLPLKATDKLVRGGQERQITFINPISYGTNLVRIELDFLG